MTTKRLKSYRYLASSLEVCKDDNRRKQLSKEMSEITNWIHSLDDPLAVRVFEERYLSMLNDRDIRLCPWNKVARKLHYSESRVKHIHSIVINAQR